MKVRRHERLTEYDIDFIRSEACNCRICTYLRTFLKQGYKMKVNLELER